MCRKSECRWNRFWQLTRKQRKSKRKGVAGASQGDTFTEEGSGVLAIALLISSPNNWADRPKFLACFFERGSGGSSAILSVASGNASSGGLRRRRRRRREHPRAGFSDTSRRPASAAGRKEKKGSWTDGRWGARPFPTRENAESRVRHFRFSLVASKSRVNASTRRHLEEIARLIPNTRMQPVRYADVSQRSNAQSLVHGGYGRVFS